MKAWNLGIKDQEAVWLELFSATLATSGSRFAGLDFEFIILAKNTFFN
jgi:hypothetical protein